MVIKKKSLHKFLLFLLIAFLVVIIDQILKYLIIKTTPDLNFEILTIHFVKNTGAGFGILPGQTFLLGIISLLVALAIIYYYPKIPSEKVPQILFALFLGGVVGNLVDRLYRHYVVDFISLSFWPAFNIADACISVAAIGLIIYFWKK